MAEKDGRNVKDSSAQALKVLYIMGFDRSGSTLLSSMLGDINGAFSVGETPHLWTRLNLDTICGCKQKIRECGFWRAVLGEAFGSLDNMDFDTLASLRRKVCTFRRMPQLAFSMLRRREFMRNVDAYASHLARLYKAISAVSGCDVIIESSKCPAMALFLHKHVSDLDVRVVHLVRDSRAVVYSAYRKANPGLFENDKGRVKSGIMFGCRRTLYWNLCNLLGHFVRLSGAPYSLVKYEDLVAKPRECIEGIVDFAGLKPGSLGHLDRGILHFAENHMVAGNRVRLLRGDVPIRIDNEWESNLDRRKRTCVTLLSAPLLLKYGYV